MRSLALAPAACFLAACAAEWIPPLPAHHVYWPPGLVSRRLGVVPHAEKSEAPGIVVEAPEPAEPSAMTLPEEPPLGPLSSPIRNGFFDPIPGGVFAGYQGDTGLDIASPPHAVYALAAGVLDYSEPGHTRWVGPTDTANSIRIRLDAPIPWKKRKITHIYYTHLSALEHVQAEGAAVKRHVVGGEKLGVSGQANGLPHLHLGFLLDDDVEQDSWDYLLREDEIRTVLGGYKNGESL